MGPCDLLFSMKVSGSDMCPYWEEVEEPVHGAPGSVSLSPTEGQHGGELEPQQFCRMNDKLIRIVVSHCVWGSFITAT